MDYRKRKCNDSQSSPDQRVIHLPVRVNEAHVVQLLLERVPPVGIVLERGDLGGGQVVIPVGGIAPQAERIEAHLLGDIALVIGNLVHAAQVIIVQVTGSRIAALVNRVHRDDLPVGDDVVPVVGGGGRRHHLEQPADVGGIRAHAVIGGRLIVAVMVRPVAERAAALGRAKARGQIIHRPGQG